MPSFNANNKHTYSQPTIRHNTSSLQTLFYNTTILTMHSIAFLATLLIPLAAAAPEVAASPAPEAAGDAIIYDSDNYSGQRKPIPVNGVCQNLGRPL